MEVAQKVVADNDSDVDQEDTYQDEPKVTKSELPP